MVLNSNDENIRAQMREEYGKIVYSYTTHLKEAKIIEKRNNIFKIINIVLSAISTCGLIAVIVDWNTKICGIITAFITTGIVIVSTYLKSSGLEEKSISHRNTAHLLWLMREKMISYLSDFDYLSHQERLNKRDDYIHQLSNIYANELLTSAKAYAMAQDALKNKEEQFFTDDEIDIMLPSSLRKKK